MDDRRSLLPGRRRLVIALAVSAGVLALLYFQLLTASRSAGRRVGIGIEQTSEGVKVTGVEPGSPAQRAGLRGGDLLLAMAGRSVTRETDYDEVASRFVRGRRVEYRVLRDGKTIAVPVVPGMPMPWPGLVSNSVVLLAYLFLALLTLHQPQRDVRTRLLFLFAVAVAAELALPNVAVGDVTLQAVSSLFFYLLTGAQVGLELHLVSVIPTRQRWLERHRWLVPLCYVLGVTVGALLGAASLLDTLGVTRLPWSSDTATTVLDLGVLPIWAVTVAGLLAAQVVSSNDSLGRHQAGLVLAGELPWALWTVSSALVGVAGGTLPAWADALEAPILLCFPVAVFVAIFRYQLLDIEVVVRRSLIYTTLTGALVLLFYAVVGAGSALFSQWVGGGVSIAVISGATLLLGLVFSPLRAWLQRIIDARFFPGRHAQRQRLAALAAELPAFGKVPLMGRHLVSQLREIFVLRSATLLVAEPKSEVLLTVASTNLNPDSDFDHSFLLSPDDAGVQALRRQRRPLPASQLASRSASFAQRLRVFDAAMVVPVMRHEDLVGLLLLGEKLSGQAYQREELELLLLLSHHVGTVFENARLFESATFDSLSGLLRREMILDQLEREMRRAVRYHRPLAVGMADLDNFKATNDRHGHLAGDALLKRVAQALSSTLRSTDTVGRYGGEEFLFVLPETDLAGARVVAEKVRGAVERIRLISEDGQVLRTTLSIGLAVLESADVNAPVEPDALIDAADRNLLRAKSAGRNRVEPG